MVQQPKALFLLAFTQAWESFSYYGMRALLVLYLISEQGYGEKKAFALYALYTCLVEFGAFLGGFCADRFTGLRNAVILGGMAICMGHLALAFADQEPLFFFGLGAIICGAMIFRGNLKALVGALYTEGDPAREAGFTLFYVGINLGGFSATVACAAVAAIWGWHAGFALAAIGMVIGMLLFCTLYRSDAAEELPASKKNLAMAIFTLMGGACIVATLLTYAQQMQVIMLPLTLLSLAFIMKILWKDLIPSRTTLMALLALLVLFFTCEELMGSQLIVFSENQIDRLLLGWEIPSSALTAVNPLVIIAAGPLLSHLLQKKGMKLNVRVGIAFLCLGSAFMLLYQAAALQNGTAVEMILCFSAIALGELFIAPGIYAYCAEISPRQHKGLMMGLVTLAFSLASLLSGQLAQVSSGLGIEGVALIFLSVALLSFFVFFVAAVMPFKEALNRWWLLYQED